MATCASSVRPRTSPAVAEPNRAWRQARPVGSVLVHRGLLPWCRRNDMPSGDTGGKAGVGQYSKIFKPYDIRGIVPDQLDEELLDDTVLVPSVNCQPE